MSPLFALVCCSLVSVALAAEANLVLLNDGVSKGAVCLDGTPPGYYLREGTGTGRNRLIMHLEGGGWCFNEDDCVGRSKTRLGSSKSWGPTATFDGFLSDDPNTNPLFFNWTLAYVKYCDGISFSGNVENVVDWKGTKLYFRGFRNLQLVVESLQSRGNFSEIILTGSSAGGLGTYIHADYVAKQFANKYPEAEFHALADAGFFIDANNTHGQPVLRTKGNYACMMQNCTGSLNQECVKGETEEPAKCFFPQYSEPYIKSKLFGLNSIYDKWQLANTLELPCQPPKCTKKEMEEVINFGKEFLEAAGGFMKRPGRGYFLDSCLTHVQSKGEHYWETVAVNGQRANETFAAWYYDTDMSHSELDCTPYPCDKSC